MATKKQEQQINELYNGLKARELKKDDISEINIKGFLYSVGRMNVLQITAFLAIKMKEYGVKMEEIYKRLGD